MLKALREKFSGSASNATSARGPRATTGARPSAKTTRAFNAFQTKSQPLVSNMHAKAPSARAATRSANLESAGPISDMFKAAGAPKPKEFTPLFDQLKQQTAGEKPWTIEQPFNLSTQNSGHWLGNAVQGMFQDMAKAGAQMGAAAMHYPEGVPQEALAALDKHSNGFEAALNKRFPAGTTVTAGELIDFATQEYAAKFKPPAGTTSWSQGSTRPGW